MNPEGLSAALNAKLSISDSQEQERSVPDVIIPPSAVKQPFESARLIIPQELVDQYLRAMPPIPLKSLSPEDEGKLERAYRKVRKFAMQGTVDHPERLITLGFILHEDDIVQCALKKKILTQYALDMAALEPLRQDSDAAPIGYRTAVQPAMLCVRIAVMLNDEYMFRLLRAGVEFINCTTLDVWSKKHIIAIHPRKPWDRMSNATEAIAAAQGWFKQYTGFDMEPMWHFNPLEFGPTTKDHYAKPYDEARVLGPIATQVSAILAALAREE